MSTDEKDFALEGRPPGARARDDHDAYGRETPDPIPMAPPVGWKETPDMVDQIRMMVRSEHMRLAALSQDKETFEEADDFEVGDDYDPTSPYEDEFDPMEEQFRQDLRQAEFAAQYQARLDAARAELARHSKTAPTPQGTSPPVETPAAPPAPAKSPPDPNP